MKVILYFCNLVEDIIGKSRKGIKYDQISFSRNEWVFVFNVTSTSLVYHVVMWQIKKKKKGRKFINFENPIKRHYSF